MHAPPRPSALIARVEQLLNRDLTRIVLSVLILLSVIPSQTIEGLYPLFFVLFACELSLRSAVFFHNLRRTGWKGAELVILGCDLLATLSFLTPVYRGTGLLRFLRLSRMVMLLGYWRDLARDVWFVLTRRERRYQFAFLFVAVLVLVVTASLLLFNLQPGGVDFDGDGVSEVEERDFADILFWSFRQVQDPGNLVSSLRDPVLVVISLTLTVFGLFLISFLIGMGTSSVEDLMRLARNRPLELVSHNIIVGSGSADEVLVRELQEIYAKNLKRARLAVLVPAEQEADFLLSPRLKSVPYRTGTGGKVAHLRRVAGSRAKRAVFLASAEHYGRDADAHVVSGVLALREINGAALIYAELRDERNLTAARLAGGPHTHVLATSHFLGYLMAQTVAFPGILDAYNELLTSENQEIYTYLFSAAEREALRRRDARLDYDTLFGAAREARALLLGVLLSPEDGAKEVALDRMDCLLDPPSQPGRFDAYRGSDGGIPAARLRGVIGLAARWEELAGWARRLVKSDPPLPAALPTAEVPELLCTTRHARPTRLTVLGFNECLPALLVELSHIFAALEVHVVAEKDSDVDSALHQLRGMIGREREPHLSGQVLSLDGCRFSFSSSAHRDLSDIWGDLEGPALEAEAFVFLGANDGGDPDAQLSLGVLRLADRHQRLGGSRPLRIVAGMQDPKKGELLRRRLEGVFGAEGDGLLTVLAGEQLKNRFVVQNMFVPGLQRVYEELSARSGTSFCRLAPATALAGPLPFGALQDAYRAQGVLVLGYEGAAGIRLNPPRTEPAPPGLTALYALARLEDVRA